MITRRRHKQGWHNATKATKLNANMFAYNNNVNNQSNDDDQLTSLCVFCRWKAGMTIRKPTIGVMGEREQTGLKTHVPIVIYLPNTTVMKT